MNLKEIGSEGVGWNKMGRVWAQWLILCKAGRPLCWGAGIT
jgi:hypothetical protein